MVQVSVNTNVPRLSTEGISPARIKEFRVEVRVFKASNADFPLGLLLSQELQDLVVDGLQVSDIEDLEDEEIYSFLRTEVLPDSLLDLRVKLEGIMCSTSTVDKSRTQVIREYLSAFTQYVDLAEDVAAKEVTPDLSFLFEKVTEPVATIVDGKAVLKSQERPANTKEVAKKRAENFKRTAKKILIARLKPAAFKKRVDTLVESCGKISYSDTVKLIRAIAKQEDQHGSVPDAPAKAAPAQGNGQGGGNGQSSGQGNGGTGGNSLQCFHCGGPHRKAVCPDLRRDRGANGGLRSDAQVAAAKEAARKKREAEANQAEVDEQEAEEPLAQMAVINGQKCSVIVDTGAGNCFISGRSLHVLKNKVKHVETRTAKCLKVRTASGGLVDSKEVARLLVCLSCVGDRPVEVMHDFRVLPGDREKILVGCSLLREVGALDDERLLLNLKETLQEQADTLDLPHPCPYLEANKTEAEKTDGGAEFVNIPESTISEDLKGMVHEFVDVFDPQLPEDGSLLEPIRINLKENANFKQRARPLGGPKLAAVRTEIVKLRKDGFIRPATGPYASPIVVVTGGHKGSEKIRLCVDYSLINDFTEKDSYPLPDIRTFVQQAAGCKFFAALDLRQGYYQVRVEEESAAKTAFITPEHFEEFTRMPFGLANAPSHFQRAMERAFTEILHEGLAIYIDDLFIYARTAGEFKLRLRRCLEICRKYALRLKAPKCTIGAAHVEVVGFVCDEKGIHLSDKRIAGIDGLSPPSTPKLLQSILGSFNYVSKFVPDSSRLLKPLNDLRTVSPYSLSAWGEKEQEAFDGFKKLVRKQLSLAFPDLNRPWHLYTDASDKGFGGILLQGESNGQEIVSFFAGTFNETQGRWSTYEQELFGIMHALTRPDLSPLFKIHPNLHVHTDHRNLLFMKNKRTTSDKLLRWSLVLNDYRFTIHHVAGIENVVADALSRVVECNEVAIVDFQTMIAEAQDGKEQEAEREGAKLTEGVWKLDDVPWLPGKGDQELKEKIIAHAHRMHEGRAKTLTAAAKIAAWRGRAIDVVNHVERCPLCRKTRLRKFLSSSAGSTIPNTIWDTVAIDTVGPITADKAGNKFIFVTTDIYSGFTELYPAPRNNAEQAARALWHVVTRHGLPRVIKSDNGVEYVNHAVRGLLKMLDLHHQRTLPYHPQSNGAVERKNGEVMRHLRWLLLAQEDYDHWGEALPFVGHILNTTIHSRTGFAPTEILYGRDVRIGTIDLSTTKTQSSGTPTADEYVRRLQKRIKAMNALARNPRPLSEVHRKQIALAKGDLVLYKPPRTPKLHGLMGPFKVIDTFPNKAVEIASLVDQSRKIIHESSLTKFPFITEEEGARLQASDKEEYVVEDIQGHQVRPCRRLLIKWLGYDEATWELYGPDNQDNDVVIRYVRENHLGWKRGRE